MPCYHPLKGFKIGINPATGKDKLKITPYTTDHVEKRPDGKYYNVLDNDVSAFAVPYRDYVDIPCGHCIGCRLSRARAWANRASLELPYHDSNVFITLTYDDDHLPAHPFFDESTGELLESYTLCPKDLQKFWKRLRKYQDEHYYHNKIRYLACGEYGDHTFRPHYHAIVFGLKLPDCKFYTKTETGDFLYTSEVLDGIWKNGKVWIGEATYESIGYVARYVTKKLYGSEASLYKDFNIIPEFLVCSRKPGLGRAYYEEHKEDLFGQSRYFVSSNSGVRSCSTDRYFNSLFENDFDPELVQERKQNKKLIFAAQNELKLKETELNYLDYLKIEEYNKKRKIESLKRD